MKNIIDLFVRKAANLTIIKEIDGLRFIAITAVVLSHFNLQIIKSSSLPQDFEYTNKLALFLELGGYGVRIFFCISAFILSIQFIKHYLYNAEKVSIKQYYFKRIKRLEIPYLLVLGILLLFRIFVEGEIWKDELPHFISSIFYSHNIIYDRRSTINPVAWTLEIEIQFYILLPAMMLLFRIKNNLKRRLLIALLIILFVCIYSVFSHAIIAAHLQYSIVPYMPVFLMGILMADIYLSNKYFLISKQFIWDILGIIGFVVILYFAGYAILYKQIIELLGYILLFVGVFKGFILNTIFTRKIVMAIGCMCYSIYLLHYAILAFIIPKITIAFFSNNYYFNLFIQAAIVLPIVLVVCGIFYLLIEKPLINNKKKRDVASL